MNSNTNSKKIRKICTCSTCGKSGHNASNKKFHPDYEFTGVSVPAQPPMIEEEISEYMSDLLECSVCLKQTKRIDLHWNEGGGSFTDVCCSCAYEARNKHNAEKKEIPAPFRTEITAPKYYMNNGSMDRHFFDEYLAENASKVVLQKINEYWTDEEDFLEYKVFGLENPSDRKVLEYSECWILDYTDGYLPIVATGINTSSCYSMCRCGMDRELDDDEEPERLTLDEICELMSKKYKTTTKTVLQNLEKRS